MCTSLLAAVGRATRPVFHGRSQQLAAAFFVGIAAICSADTVLAEDATHTYAIRLAGLQIGTAILDTTLTPQRYGAKVRGQVGWLGMRRRFEGEASGTRSGQQFVPETFRMSMSGSPSRDILVRFAGSSVMDYAITPPIAERDLRGRLPITEEQLKRVTDPLSALMSNVTFARRDLDQPCRGTSSVFIGLARFDISLAPKPQEQPGTSLSATCRVTYTPVGGHRPADASARRLAGSPEIEINLDRNSPDKAWTVARIAFPTPVGNLLVQRLTGRSAVESQLASQ